MDYETYMDAACEAMLRDTAYDLYEAAQEGNNIDVIGAWMKRLKDISHIKSEMKKAEKAGDYNTAAQKANEAANYFGELAGRVDALRQSKGSRILANIAVVITTLLGVRIVAKAWTHTVGKATGKSMLKDIKGLPDKLMNAATDDAAAGIVAKSIMGNLAKGAGVTIGGIAAEIGGGVATWKFLKGKGFKKRDDIAKIDLTENDKNKFIQALKADCQKGQQLYQGFATQYKQMAQGDGSAANESFVDWDGLSPEELFPSLYQ